MGIGLYTLGRGRQAERAVGYMERWTEERRRRNHNRARRRNGR